MFSSPEVPIMDRVIKQCIGKDYGAEGGQVAVVVDSLVLLHNQIESGTGPPTL